MTPRDIAISDIHGCLKTFKALLEKVDFTQDDTLYLLGDYIDRGPDSKGVIDYILELQQSGYQVKCLMGNHEQMLLDAFKDPLKQMSFLRHGGKQTLLSYGFTFEEMVTHPHIVFFENLDYYFVLEGYLLAHAGFNFNEASIYDDTNAMIWIRKWYDQIDKSKLNGKIIVHGHTPMPATDIQDLFMNMEANQYMDIDAGCFYYGSMCALDLTNRKLYFQERLDEVNY